MTNATSSYTAKSTAFVETTRLQVGDIVSANGRVISALRRESDGYTVVTLFTRSGFFAAEIALMPGTSYPVFGHTDKYDPKPAPPASAGMHPVEVFRLAVQLAAIVTLLERTYGHDGRGCALAGRDIYDEAACKPCSVRVAYGA